LKEFLPKDGNGDIASDLKALLVSLYGNCAMVALKLNNYRDAMQSSSLVLKYDSGNVKSLYRRAVAYNNLGYYDDAKVFPLRAFSLFCSITHQLAYLLTHRRTLIKY